MTPQQRAEQLAQALVATRIRGDFTAETILLNDANPHDIRNALIWLAAILARQSNDNGTRERDLHLLQESLAKIGAERE